MLEIKKEFLEKIKLAQSSKDLQEIKNVFFSKKGKITTLMNTIKDCRPEERKQLGKDINNLKNELMRFFLEKNQKIEEEEYERKVKSEKIDVTARLIDEKIGKIHPLRKTIRIIEDIFTSLGYYVVNGPEIETDIYNFEKLNIPSEHPARDMQDSFYITEKLLLRTHTSGVQIREMIDTKGSLKMISHGKVYRRDEDDATHSHQFMQIEGLWIGKNVSLIDLKETLQFFLSNYFEKEVDIFLRPSYFPFTEPSIEVDVQCVNCDGNGCNICKNTGKLEILGAGMVHKNVLENCGLDSEKYQGFAFGVGVERITMLKNRVNDIRDFYTNDKKFLDQF